MTPAEFIKKWKPVSLTERAAAHTHFLDLCKLFEHDDPISADPTGDWFTFEKGATKTGGGEGFADVWKKNFFAWEYKKKKRDLNAAMEQLVRYAAALENPPLQVVCDTDRFIIRTAWTNTVPKTYEIELDDLALPEKRDILWAVFHDPERLRPRETRAGLTREAADKFSTIALRLQGRGTPEDIAHFVNQLVFCFFANSVKLLPEGFLPKLLKLAAENPDEAIDDFNNLFAAMETGGRFGLDKIAFFNGGLFDGRRAIRLDSGDIGLLVAAAKLDWSQIDPTIFGTLFERFLDPDKRAQIGAHYTDSDKIMMIVEPVILRPLRTEWEAAKVEIEGFLSGKIKLPEIQLDVAGRMQAGIRLGQKRRLKPIEAAEATRSRFLERLRTLSILDPACGSGNFLYLALQGVKDIELKANLESEALGLPARLPVVGPEIVHGIEINSLAAELARTTIWIGDIQWRIRNGIYSNPQPILRKLDAIECRDALITKQEDETFIESEWPEAEFIVGNPPFLGNKEMISQLGETETANLRNVYSISIQGGVDLVTFWFFKAFAATLKQRKTRSGLVATQSIRRGANRSVLDKIVSEFTIFEAWSDEAWIVDGAAVRVSIICFGQTTVGERTKLNGISSDSIHSDLTGSSLDLTKAVRLTNNRHVTFQGTIKAGNFDVPGAVARRWLIEPLNPNQRPNSDVIWPWANGSDLAGRSSNNWIIDFGPSMTERDAAHYQIPFQHVLEQVKPVRSLVRRQNHRTYWWRHGEARPGLRQALSGLQRFLATPRVSKHRFFVWLHATVIPDSRLVVVARQDETTFGILQSQFHEAWSLRLGGWHGVGNDPQYTPSLGFETFPFPQGLTPNISAKDYEADPRAQAIAKAAKRLDDLRNAWLNPPDLVVIEPEVVPGYPDRILPKDAQAAVVLRTRTLTNLYNQRPQWLADAHRDLDAAVAAAYGWQADISEEDALAKLLELNLARAGPSVTAEVPSEEASEDDE